MDMDVDVTAQFDPQKRVTDLANKVGSKAKDLCDLIGIIASQCSEDCQDSIGGDSGDQNRLGNLYSVLAAELDQSYKQFCQFQDVYQDRDEQTDTPPTLIE